jgi:hypothetical protein
MNFHEGISLEERINCPECEDTRKRLYIKKVSGGYIRHCHNNNCYEGKGFVATDGRSTPSDTIRHVIHTVKTDELSTDQTVKNIQLPLDANSTIPVLGLGWLYKYYITDEEIKKYGICYSEQYRRLILPVYQDEQLIYWQGRSLKPPETSSKSCYTKDNPKYLNIRQSGAKNVFFKVTLSTIPLLVVVEDILSAIRVGRTHNSLALLGSYFPTTLLKEFSQYDKIIIYLDHDKWQTAIKAAIKFNKITGKQFVIKDHLLDPKALSPDELQTFLEDR